MKSTTKTNLFLCIASLLLLIGCKKDDSDENLTVNAPSIKLIASEGSIVGDTTLAKGTYYYLKVEAVQENSTIERITIYQNDKEKFNNQYASSTVNDSFKLMKSADEVDEIILLVTNAEGISDSLLIKVAILSGLINYTGITLENTDGIDLNTLTFYSTSSNQIYSYSDCDGHPEIQSKIDFGFMWALSSDSTDLNFCLLSIDEYWRYSWGYNFDDWELNTCEFKTNFVNYDNADIEAIQASYPNMDLSPGNIAYPDGKIAINLDAGSTIAFQNTVGKLGIIKISQINANTSNFDQTITFDLKIQE